MQAFALFMFESYGDLYTLKGNYILALENYMKSGNLDKVSDTKDKLNE